MALVDVERVSCDVSLQEDRVELRLVDPQPRTLSFFAAHEAPDHALLAQEAWQIGIRALESAFAQAEEVRLKDVGQALVEDVDRQLKNYMVQQEKAVNEALKRYFSPDDGMVTERMKAFIDDDGDLARVLKGFVAPDSSVLAKTLAQQVGERSPLFRMLSPTESEGVVQQIQKRFQQALEGHTEAVAEALDPAREGTPVHRFMVHLREDLEKAGGDQEKRLKALMQAIDPTDEESLINRLQRDVSTANKELLKAINPEEQGSAMATIKGTLTKLIEKHMEDNRELLEKSEKRQRTFEVEVKEALARIEQRRKEAERTTHGGLEFEDAVLARVGDFVQAGPYITEATGNTVGHVSGSKVGDQVIRFTKEHAFAGCGLVVEAKRAGHYTVSRALDELEEAKKNRGCDVGVFVMAAGHRPRGFPSFARYGSSVLVVWDEEDPATDAYLHAAVLTGLALATRRRASSEGDIAALHDVETRVRSEIDRLEKMVGFVGNIQRDAGKIEDEIRKGKSKLDVLIRKANDVLAALKVDVQEEGEERATPVLADEDAHQQTLGLHDSRLEGDGDDAAHRFSSMEAAPQVAARRVRSADEVDDRDEDEADEERA